MGHPPSPRLVAIQVQQFGSNTRHTLRWHHDAGGGRRSFLVGQIPADPPDGAESGGD